MTDFRTRRGNCVVSENGLQLHSSVRGRLKRLAEAHPLRILLYVIIPMYPIYTVVQYGIADVWPGLAIGLALAAVYLTFGYGYNYVRGFTYDDTIPRDSITAVKPVRGTKGISRPRFVVVYEREGAEKRRYIQMPSTFLAYGGEEFEKAKEILRSAGLPIVDGSR